MAFGDGGQRVERIEDFLSRKDDEGYAGCWRACLIRSRTELDREFRNAHWGARHFCFSETSVRYHARRAVRTLIKRCIHAEKFAQAIGADVDTLSRVVQFLRSTAVSAVDDVESMLNHIFYRRTARSALLFHSPLELMRECFLGA